MTTAVQFQLKVQWVPPLCLFELSWGRGQQISSQVLYPDALSRLYQTWQQTYLQFYKTSLRGTVAAVGSLAPEPVDWHAKLIQAEAQLLLEFHRWLRGPELFEIRATLAQAASPTEPKSAGTCVNVFLVCTPLELARLPWEAWEIAPEFGAGGTIRFARMPATLRGVVTPNRPFARRVRILTILGDETGLDFQVDRQAVESLAPIATLRFVGWQPGLEPTQLKTQMAEAIADPQGWDILFFVGHSNETSLTGGELAIIPGVSLRISELVPQILAAKQRGLKFAIFNSCSGLEMGNTLIDLGLGQVAVMREPIHNQVAQAFLVQFVQCLAQYQDVHNALLAACRYLKLEKSLTYPSAYLIPSLFRHPDSDLFRLQPLGWWYQIKPWLPNRTEATVLNGLLLLSLLQPVQDFLLNGRVGLQAVYRAMTGQVAEAVSPPTLLVQVDEQSIRRAGMSNPNPMDRRYLASLVHQLSGLQARVVGIDYLLDRPQLGRDAALSQAIQTAITRQRTWFIFASLLQEDGGDLGVTPETGIASTRWMVQGNVAALPQYVKLPQGDCLVSCPFAYLVAVVQTLLRFNTSGDGLPQPSLQRQTDLRSQLLDHLQRKSPPSKEIAFLQHAQASSLSLWFEQVGQLWLRPINDFSIPPEQVYNSLPAWKLLAGQFDRSQLQRNLNQQVVCIVPWGYSEAGVMQPGADNFPLPLAIAFWRALQDEAQDPATSTEPFFSGAEAQAYMIYSFVRQQFVTPIPDAWMILLAAIAGKASILKFGNAPFQGRRGTLSIALGIILYGAMALQLYISTALLFPWLLPSMMFWVYVKPKVRKEER